MRTSELIEMLARGAGPAPTGVAARRFGPAAAFGLVASAGLALALLGPIPREMLATPAPWLKLAYGGAMAAAAGWLAARLGRPAAPVGVPVRAVLAVLAAVAGLGAAALWSVPVGERLADLRGHSWQACPSNVLLLSLPALGAALWAMRGLAPTRPAAAGFAAGLAAGALGAIGYSMSCTEASPAFVAVWYTLGIVLVGALGAVLGRRWLRW